MSTVSNRTLEEAREKIRGAIKDLAKIVIDEESGAIDFSESFRDDLALSMQELIKIRSRIC